MEEMIKCVKEVLKKYDKKYSTQGVEKNLTAWNENKRGLIDLLRNHPNWNEDAMAVVTEIVETREIDEAKTLEALSSVEFLHPVFNNNDLPPIYKMNDYAMYCNALYEAATPFQKNITGEIAESVKQYANIRCADGEKCSKVINKVCESYGVNEHVSFNKLFAKLSDSVNPHAIKRKVILSVHPCDYLEMSNKDNSWSSCHKLSGGAYQAGTLSYMNDGVSMILYSISEKDTSNIFYKAPKVNRQVYCYKDGVLLQSRLYPNDDDVKTRSEYGEIVKNIFAACHQTTCDWTVSEEINEENAQSYCVTHPKAKHYPDYIYDYGEVTRLSEVALSYEPMTIGAEAYCMYCGETITDASMVVCGNCKYQPMHYCDVCGGDFPESELVNTELGGHMCQHCREQQNAVNEAGETA